MTRATRSPQSLALQTILLGCFALTAGTAATCQAQEADATAAREERSAEMDEKVTSLRDQFRILKTKWNAAADQAKENLGAELEVARRELGEIYDEREADYDAALKELSQSIETAWTELEGKGQVAKADAAKKLDEIREAWNSSSDQLRTAQQQHVAHYREELASIERQLAAASDDLNAEWITRRTAARQQYERTAASMRRSYEESIDLLEKEIARLRAYAEQASEQNKAKFAVMADSFSAQMNVLHQELQVSYQDAAEKASSYLKSTKARLAAADAEVRVAIQAETDQVSEATCQLNAEMAAAGEEYRDSLVVQLSSLKQRAETAQGGAKQRLSELESKLRVESDKAEQHIDYAYKSYVAALNQDIDYMKQRLSDTDRQARQAMVEAIERRQAELERAQKKLSSSQQ